MGMLKSLACIGIMATCIVMLAQCTYNHDTNKCAELAVELGTTGTYINNTCYLKDYGTRR